MRLDETIKKDVVDSIYWDSRIDASDISVMVDGGRVEITGEVPSYTARQAVEEDAWFVNGVVAVENQLAVRYPERPAVPTDQDIETNVRDALRWDPDLYSFKINANVMNGMVTLEGTVDAYWKKVHAENIIQGMRGVIDVTNKLAVVPTEDITDESIAEDVVKALDRNMNVSAEAVDVTVLDGKVTLSGTVSGWTAKSAAYNSALYTLGVTDVKDNLIVEYS